MEGEGQKGMGGEEKEGEEREEKCVVHTHYSERHAWTLMFTIKPKLWHRYDSILIESLEKDPQLLLALTPSRKDLVGM